MPSTYSAIAGSSVASAGAGSYIHWGVINISVTNALIILGMLVVFVLALVLPFPQGSHEDESTGGGE